MQNALPQLGRTIDVHAAVIGLALCANHLSPAHRASLRHVKQAVPARMISIVKHAAHFRDYVTATLHFHPVANLDPEPLDFVHILTRGAADRCSSDRYRPEHCDRRKLSRAPYLYTDGLDLGDA